MCLLRWCYIWMQKGGKGGWIARTQACYWLLWMFSPLQSSINPSSIAWTLRHRRREQQQVIVWLFKVLEALPQAELAMYIKLMLYWRNECVFLILGVLGRSLKVPGDLVTKFGGLGRKILTPYPTTARGLRCYFQTSCNISIAKTLQIIPCLPHFLLLNEHSSRPDKL